jgi:hypothetical protein
MYATRHYRNKTIDEATWRARLSERRQYAMRSHSKADQDGHVRLQCPAAGSNPTGRCELKPASEAKASTLPRIRIHVTTALRGFPPKVCTQQSVTVPPESGAKFAQPLPHESDEWQAHYAVLRSAIEGMNGFIKDGAHEALDDAERRRIRGVAAQSVLVAFQLFAANLRKIRQFLADKGANVTGIRKRAPRRTTRRLGDFLSAVSTADIPSTSADPDPPLSA